MRQTKRVPFCRPLQCLMGVMVRDGIEAQTVRVHLLFENGDELTVVFPIPGNSKIEMLRSHTVG